jgi:tRNA uridine 5-carboxymethylaminomethyl modification enzyme
MFTSRAEHRLILRQDNAHRRLLKYGHEFGLVSGNLYRDFIEREALISKSKELFSELKVKPDHINRRLSDSGSSEIHQSETVEKLTKRPELKLKDILMEIDEDIYPIINAILNDPIALQQVEIEFKYDGYISKQKDLISKIEKLENVQIPLNFNYLNLNTISMEGREKLTKVKPRSIGQASRISGVSPSDISILLVYLKN